MRVAARTVVAAAALLAGLLPATHAGAAGVAGVIVASDVSAGTVVEFAAVDGSGLRATIPGDRTHAGVPRFVAFADADGITVRNEADGRLTASSTDPVTSRQNQWWSPDDRTLLVLETRTLPDGTTTQQLAVATVGWAAGEPASVSPTRPFVTLGAGDRTGTNPWSPDGLSVVIGQAADLVAVDTATGARTTLAHATTTVSDPAWSPVADQIAYVLKTNKAGSPRTDIFVFDRATRTTRQVTSKANANVTGLMSPAWAPDGSAFAFGAWDLSVTAVSAVYRIAATGSQKAVRLTSGPHQYNVPRWRR